LSAYLVLACELELAIKIPPRAGQRQEALPDNCFGIQDQVINGVSLLISYAKLLYRFVSCLRLAPPSSIRSQAIEIGFMRSQATTLLVAKLIWTV